MVTAEALVDAFVDQLIRASVRHVVFSPGSRSTPLALAFARRKEVRMIAQLDERSAGFLALGLAKGSRSPAALLCTSGTAAANYLPAIVEARYGRTPLLVLTADRPHEARELGSPQTIDQIKMYGGFVKFFADMPPAGGPEETLSYVRTTAARAVAVSTSLPAGPVHLNFPFREPLLPAPHAVGSLHPAAGGRPGPEVHAPEPAYAAGALRPLAEKLATLRRGLVVCGPQEDPGLAGALVRMADRLGYPVLADPLSQVRFGEHDRTLVVDAYDWLLRSEAFAQASAPDVVVHVGALPTSKSLAQFMKERAGRLIVVDAGEWNDPTLRATDVVRAGARAACEAIAAALEPRPDSDPAWIDLWTRGGRIARESVERRLAGIDPLFEGRIARELVDLLPDGASLVVGNSMPVRDVDAFAAGQRKRLRLIANRGANGIDGVVSTACGVALASGPSALLIGDVSFFHDANGLLANKLEGVDLTVVLVNNDGGGIFSLLPQAGIPDGFERLFGTPHGLDFEAVVTMHGGRFARARNWDELRDFLRRALDRPGLDVIEVKTNRGHNAELHRWLWNAVARDVEAFVQRRGSEGGMGRG